jgi:hypothetical protein
MRHCKAMRRPHGLRTGPGLAGSSRLSACADPQGSAPASGSGARRSGARSPGLRGDESCWADAAAWAELGLPAPIRKLLDAELA